jgi:hypothetical protein
VSHGIVVDGMIGVVAVGSAALCDVFVFLAVGFYKSDVAVIILSQHGGHQTVLAH